MGSPRSDEVLALLRERPCTVVEISATTGMTQHHVQGIVRELWKRKAKIHVGGWKPGENGWRIRLARSMDLDG